MSLSDEKYATPVEDVLASEIVNLTWLALNYHEYVAALAERGERFRFAEVDGQVVALIEPIGDESKEEDDARRDID